LKKAAKKDAKIADLRADYEEFLAEWEPIEANIGIAEVDTFFIHTNELFALLQRVEENTAFIEMVPEPYFDEEMGVTDTIWNAKNKNTNEPIAKNDALKVYSIATLNLTEAAARGVSLTAESVSALASLTSDPLKALTIGKKVKQATKAIKMSVNVIPLIQRDYAQGRKDKRTTEVRKKLLQDINTALIDTNVGPLDLNFIYGKSTNGKFIPLDEMEKQGYGDLIPFVK